MKILYAAGNSYNSRIQLSRFIRNFPFDKHKLKISAYKKSSPSNLSIDWTLDPLLPRYGELNGNIDDDSSNFELYYHNVKYYYPDLIVSDLEFFTSKIAITLNVPLWQYSSSLLNFALSRLFKYRLKLFSQTSAMYADKPYHEQLLYVLANSDRKFLCSHLCDLDKSIITSGYTWVRPYFLKGKPSRLCEHNIVAAFPNTSHKFKILNALKKYNDCVVFSDFTDEKYNNIIMKPQTNEQEYVCNLHNSRMFVGEGQAEFLSDAFYNGKYSLVFPNQKEFDCIVNSACLEKTKTGTCIYGNDFSVERFLDIPISIDYDDQTKHFHEHLVEA